MTNHWKRWTWLVVFSSLVSGPGRATDSGSTGLYHETYRPQFHFSANQGWLNDPNGLVYYQGVYHLFFQHDAKHLTSKIQSWGHATSPDLVHWTQVDDAIKADQLYRIWSGSAVVDWNNTAGLQVGSEKTLVALYTAAAFAKQEPYAQRLSFSTDKGMTWTPYSGNPVLPTQAPHNRDPKVIWYEPTKSWILALYKQKSNYALFSSPDLKTWKFLQEFTVPKSAECPDFFEIAVNGDPTHKKWVFIGANGHYLVGTFDGTKFTPEVGPFPEDDGKNFYAGQTFSDIPAADGRRIQTAWMRGGVYPGMPFNQQLSFPCELTLRAFPEGLRICRQPVKEIDLLHDKEQSWPAQGLAPGENPLANVKGDLFDIRAEIDPGSATEVGFKIRGTPVSYSVKDQKITCLGATTDMASSPKITLQLLVDRTSLEVFGNEGKVSITSCFLPDPKNQDLELYALGGTAKIVSLKVYPLHSAW
jgi:fructan beta-fructosidase